VDYATAVMTPDHNPRLRPVEVVLMMPYQLWYAGSYPGTSRSSQKQDYHRLVLASIMKKKKKNQALIV
jgi:hypothetical protein